MEIQAKQATATPPVAMQAPPPPVADQRPSADAAAMAGDKTPQTPLPVPPTPHQQALVGKLMMAPAEDAGTARPDAPVAQAERTLKPYGITMLPARDLNEAAARPETDPTDRQPDQS